MDLRDFVIGESFWTEAGQFRCTDIGTRVVVAIKLGPTEVVIVDDTGETYTRLDEDPSWFDGPPYAVEEVVFDEDDQIVCFPTEAAMLAEREARPPSSSSEHRRRRRPGTSGSSPPSSLYTPSDRRLEESGCGNLDLITSPLRHRSRVDAKALTEGMSRSSATRPDLTP